MPKKNLLDELGIEPKTSPMLRERATNYATRPSILYKSLVDPAFMWHKLLNHVMHFLYYFVQVLLLIVYQIVYADTAVKYFHKLIDMKWVLFTVFFHWIYCIIYLHLLKLFTFRLPL